MTTQYTPSEALNLAASGNKIELIFNSPIAARRWHESAKKLRTAGEYQVTLARSGALVTLTPRIARAAA